MIGRGEITDKAWKQIVPLLPENGRRGGQWSEHRKVVNGILWRLRTGAPWRDLPSRYGPWQTCYERFVRWRRDGTWDRLLTHVQTKADAVGEVEWEVSVDDTVVRAHQHAAGARRTRPSHKDAKRGFATRWRKRSEEAVEAFPPRSISPVMAKAGHFR
jgi:transposase